MILEDEPEEQDGIDYLTYVTVVEKDEEYAELVYIIYKPVVDPIISYTVTVDVENADVTIDGEPYTGLWRSLPAPRSPWPPPPSPATPLLRTERRVHY